MAPETPPPPSHSKLGRALGLGMRGLGHVGGLIGWLLGGLLALSASLAVLGYGWAGSPQSLSQALAWAQDWLRDPDTGTTPLNTEGVQGSLLRGGSVAQLRWMQDDLLVEVEELTLSWTAQQWLDLLLERRWAMSRLSALRVEVTPMPLDTPDPDAAAARRPPSALVLPWLTDLSVPVQVGEIHYHGPAPVVLNQLDLNYRYAERDPAAKTTEPPTLTNTTSPWHQLTLHSVQWAQGPYQSGYQGQARLQAQAPMHLDAEVRATVTTPSTGPLAPLSLQLLAQAAGTLSGEAAVLELTAQLQARPAPSAAAGAQARPDRRQALPELTAQVQLRPWATLPVNSGDLQFQHIDLAALLPNAPTTRLHGAWQARQATLADPWRLQGSLRNDLPGPWHRRALPLQSLSADVALEDPHWRIHRLEAEAAGGTLTAQGQARIGDPSAHTANAPWLQRVQSWDGAVNVRGLNLTWFNPEWAIAPLDLTLRAQTPAGQTAAPTALSLHVAPTQPAPARPGQLAAPTVDAQGNWTAERWALEQASLRFLGAEIEAQGDYRPRPGVLTGKAALSVPGTQAGWAGALQTTKPRQWAPSMLNTPGQAHLHVTDASVTQQWAISALARLSAWSSGQDGLTALLEPLRQQTWRGDAQWRADWTPAAPGSARFNTQLQVGHGQWPFEPADAAPAPGSPMRALRDLRAEVSGLVQLGGASPQFDATIQRLQATLLEPHGPVTGLHVAMAQPLAMAWSGAQALSVGPGALSLAPTWAPDRPAVPPSPPLALSWDTLKWQAGRLSTQGRLRGLALRWVDAWLAPTGAAHGPLFGPDVSGDVALDATWTLDLPLRWAAAEADTPPARARVELFRTQGDLTLNVGDASRAERLSAGIEDARLAIDWLGKDLKAELRWRSRQAGNATAFITTQLTAPSAEHPTWSWPASAPWQGRLQADLPQLGPLVHFVPPGWRVSGQITANAQLQGSRAQPEWSGQVQARQLALRSVVEGLDFSGGEIDATIRSDAVTIDRFELQGAGGATGGRLRGTGSVRWPANTTPATPIGAMAPTPAALPELQLNLQAEQLRLLARPDRRLTLSGQLTSRLQGQRLDIGGQLRADQALMLLPDESTPTLSADVVVRGGRNLPPPAAQRVPLQVYVQVGVDLGQDFKVRGQGVDTYLEGQLQVSARPPQTVPQLTGQVRTVRGTFKAYGQTLNIEQGDIRFNGPYDNPSVDILALRPHPTQRVGVAVTGAAQAPQLRLYADPELPDSEKLAWLLLGRPASGTAAQSAVLQQAALALLSGRGADREDTVLRTLGLDEFTVQGEATNADGSTSAASVTLGKRLSSRLYLSYSRSVVGVVGTVAMFYDLSRKLTLRAQAGDDNAFDILFSHSFDGTAQPGLQPAPAKSP